MSTTKEGNEMPWPEPSGIWATYDLHCHCGAVRYNIKLSPPLYEEDTQGKGRYTAVECNCSHCERHGYIAVHPLSENVTWVQGQDDLTRYYCAAKQNPHLFCRHCGSVVGTDLSGLSKMMGGEPRMTVNVSDCEGGAIYAIDADKCKVRMLKDFDWKKLQIKPMEYMKHFGPKYSID